MNTATRVLVPLEVSAAPPRLGAAVHTVAGLTMGTTWCVKLSGPAGLAQAPLQARLQQALDHLVAQMSPWQPGSAISRFNRAEAGSCHTLPDEFATVMHAALAVAEASGGAFDPSAGELVNLWGFGPPGPVVCAPQAEALAPALGRRGWQRLAWVDPGPHPELTAPRRLRQPGGVVLDLSAIAKGFAVDHLARVLQSLGHENHLVEVGGELLGSGIRPDGQPWWVDLHTPAAPGAAVGVTRVALHGLAVATSGDYLRCFQDETGQRHAHTIDPRTGWPARHGLASVSVVHRECLWADAWSTALMVLGPAEGLALAEQHGLAALLVERRGHGLVEHLSTALKALAA